MYFYDNTILCLSRFAVGLRNFLSSSIKKITRRVSKSKGVAEHSGEKEKYSQSCIKNAGGVNIIRIEMKGWRELMRKLSQS